MLIHVALGFTRCSVEDFGCFFLLFACLFILLVLSWWVFSFAPALECGCSLHDGGLFLLVAGIHGGKRWLVSPVKLKLIGSGRSGRVCRRFGSLLRICYRFDFPLLCFCLCWSRVVMVATLVVWSWLPRWCWLWFYSLQLQWWFCGSKLPTLLFNKCGSDGAFECLGLWWWHDLCKNGPPVWPIPLPFWCFVISG